MRDLVTITSSINSKADAIDFVAGASLDVGLNYLSLTTGDVRLFAIGVFGALKYRAKSESFHTSIAQIRAVWVKATNKESK